MGEAASVQVNYEVAENYMVRRVCVSVVPPAPVECDFVKIKSDRRWKNFLTRKWHLNRSLCKVSELE